MEKPTKTPTIVVRPFKQRVHVMNTAYVYFGKPGDIFTEVEYRLLESLLIEMESFEVKKGQKCWPPELLERILDVEIRLSPTMKRMPPSLFSYLMEVCNEVREKNVDWICYVPENFKEPHEQTGKPKS